MEHCPFCPIVDKGLPPHGLYEDASCMVVLERESLGEGHCIVLSKRHASKLYELGEREFDGVLHMARRLAPHLEQATGCRFVGFVAFAGGSPHAHIHLVPHDDPDLLMQPMNYVRALSANELKAGAARLRERLPPRL